MKKSEALKILGLSSSYTEDDIKKAHRQKIRENHPDQFADPEKKAQAEEQTKLINEARDVLVNKRWDPEYGPRTGYNPYGNPYSSPYSNPFGGYGSPYSQYRPGAGQQGGSSNGSGQNPYDPFGWGQGDSGQSPFGAGFPFDFVWTSWDGTRDAQGGSYNPFDPFSSVFNREPEKTAEQEMEDEKKTLRMTAIFVVAKLLVLAMCIAAGSGPVGVSIYIAATLIFALFRETDGCARALAFGFILFFAPMLIRLVGVVLAASSTPAAIVVAVIAAIYDVRVLWTCIKRYREAKRKAEGDE